MVGLTGTSLNFEHDYSTMDVEMNVWMKIPMRSKLHAATTTLIHYTVLYYSEFGIELVCCYHFISQCYV
jgi:hypothetical protein